MLHPGNAGSSIATDHIEVTKAALAKLPGGKTRPGKGVLIRADSAGGTHEFMYWLTAHRVSYSVGFTLPYETPKLYKLIRRTCGQLHTLDLRHRRRALCEDRIRKAKNAGLRNLPLHGFDQNRIWYAIVALTSDLLA